MAGDRPLNDDVLPGAEREGIGNTAISGGRWLAGTQGATEVISFVSLVVLARLVAPDQYGYAAAAVLFPTVAEVLLYEGFGTALVRRRSATYGEARVATTLSLASGLLLFVAVFFGVKLAGGSVAATQVHLIQLAGGAFLLSAPNIVPQALQQRRLAFRTIAMRDTAGAILGVLSSVVFALAGLGGTAVILGLLVRRLTITVLLQLVTERVGPGWDRSVARSVLSFGTSSSIAGVLFLAKKNIDYFILSFLISPTQLGFYYRGYSLGVDYQGKVSQTSTRMALPLLARSRDNEDMWYMRKRLSRLQMSLVVPVLAVFAVTAPQVIPVVFGERWAPAASAAQILVIVPFIGMVGSGTGPLMMAQNRPGVLAWTNAASVVLYALTILAFGHMTLIHLCWVVAAYNVIFTVVSAYVSLNLILDYDVKDLVVELVQPLVAVLPTLALLPVVRHFDVSLPAMLLAVIGVGSFCLVTYKLVMRTLFRETWTDISSVARRFVPRRRQVVTA